mgnify:FL=1
MFSTASWSAGQDAPVPVARGALPLLLPLSDPPARRHRPPVEMGVQTSLDIQVLQQRAGRHPYKAGSAGSREAQETYNGGSTSKELCKRSTCNVDRYGSTPNPQASSLRAAHPRMLTIFRRATSVLTK